MLSPARALAPVLLGVLFVGCAPTPGPRFSSTGPDAEAYGAGQGYRFLAIYRQPYLVGVFSHGDLLFESRTIPRAAAPSSLRRAPVEPVVHYEHAGQTRTLDDYLARQPATALLIARGDTILVERYQYARTDRHRLNSFSMAKTVTGMLIGIALAEGRIRSVEDTAAAYVPALAGTEYGATPLRHLLQMSSGVRFIENYSGSDDSARLVGETFHQNGRGGAEALKPFNVRVRPPGSRFVYASAETQVLGLVLREVTGRPVADYFREKIWEPIGAEGDAAWFIDRAGQEATYCCLNAVLRDYARLGLLLARDGRQGARQLIPRDWIRTATTVRPDDWHLKPYAATSYYGYGYQTWILPGPRRMFALLGAHGQAMFVDPASQLVMVHTAVMLDPADFLNEGRALWQGVVATLGARD
ncbi:MAG TPA: serine hydrolase [Methylomirabilota bacterium]|nr:serine hydrolase [Methylomirabilota bacterium]